jgi:hypothetical protein
VPAGFAGLAISSSRRPSEFTAKVMSNSEDLRRVVVLGVFTQPSCGSKRLIVCCGPIPSRRSPPSSTAAATTRLMTIARRTLSAFMAA